MRTEHHPRRGHMHYSSHKPMLMHGSCTGGRPQLCASLGPSRAGDSLKFANMLKYPRGIRRLGPAEVCSTEPAERTYKLLQAAYPFTNKQSNTMLSQVTLHTRLQLNRVVHGNAVLPRECVQTCACDAAHECADTKRCRQGVAGSQRSRIDFATWWAGSGAAP